METERKRKTVKNTFDITQFKKLVGKKLILPYKKAADKKTILELSKNYAEKILSGKVKQIILSGFLNTNGTLYIFDGLEKYYALESLSYLAVKKIETPILVIQYSNVKVSELAMLKA
jgi:hypothetical protein